MSASFQPIGTIIAAVLAAIAAVIILIGQIGAKDKQNGAAAKDELKKDDENRHPP